VKLRVLTPTEVILEEDVTHVTAEDVTGSLGIRPGHATLVTPLAAGIVIARAAGGGERYVAVNGGVMIVTGEEVEIVSRQAVASSDLAHLEGTVLEEFDKEEHADRTNKVAFEKMRLNLMRRVLDVETAGEIR
jgi:F-type H+-transporting ATPase subunit epsilon